MNAGSLSRLRQTLAKPTEIYSGIGLHSGVSASIRFMPAAAGTGRVFVDPATGATIAATAANVSDTSRCTQIRAGDATVQTVEHVLAALSGLNVDDVVIELCGKEPPAADGSAALFVALIQQAGVRGAEPGTPLVSLSPSRPYLVSDGRGSTIVALPAAAFSATVVLDYPNHPYIGTQAFSFDDTGDFCRDIAPARTFGFLGEQEALRANGLALGASRENAIALGEDGYDSDLRFSDELARHKLLDLIGDLSLIGMPLRAHVFAIKPGHTLNARLAYLLLEQDYE